MSKEHIITGVIPARGGSKGIPGKNVKLINGKPLILYTIEAALESKSIDLVVVSTDDSEIAKVASVPGVKVVMRPANLAQADTPTEPVVEHVIEKVMEELDLNVRDIVLLQPTSPLRTSEDIDNAFRVYITEKSDSLLSVSESHSFLWTQAGESAKPLNYNFLDRPRRQDMNQYAENGAIYIFSKKLFDESKSRLGGKISMYVMPPESSREIDDIADCDFVEYIMNRNVGAKSVHADILNNIKMLVLDVDGVLTDGGMYYDEDGNEMKLFNTHDGKGISLLQQRGIIVAIITQENSQIVIRRAKKLKIDEVHIGIENKLEVFEKLLRKYGLKSNEVAYVGDDLNDIPVLKKVGFPVAAGNGMDEVKACAKYITKTPGGHGAVREVSNVILKNRRAYSCRKEV